MSDYGVSTTDWAPWSQSAAHQDSVTAYGKGVNVLADYWSRDTTTVTTDTVNLNAALAGATPDTPQSQLTTSLAKLLQGASHVDAVTGTREINQGIGETLASQVTQLLTAGGFSQSDASQAAASLLSQFQQASSGTGSIAVSLSGQSNSASSYKTSVAGGTELSAYSLQSTSTLSIDVDAQSGALSVTLNQHNVGATQIGWYTDGPPTDVSITLTSAELQGVAFDAGTSSSYATGSPVSETQVVTGNGVEGTSGGNNPAASSQGGSETGAAILAQALAREDAPLDTNPADFASNSVNGTAEYRVAAAALQPVETALLQQLTGGSAATPSSTPASVPAANGGTPATPPAAAQNAAVSDAQAALKNVTDTLNQIRTYDSQQSKSVGLKLSHKVGIVGVQSNKAIVKYARPTGTAGTFDLPGVSLKL